MNDNRETQNRWGLCPKCYREPVYRHINTEHFACCDKHRVYWLTGIGLYETFETEKSRLEDRALLDDYREVEPFMGKPPKPAAANYFDGKTFQVEPGVLTAFGVQISSQYGKAQELVEMLEFVALVAKEGLLSTINSVFYESETEMCNINWSSTLRMHGFKGSLLEKKLLGCALKTLSEFRWLGVKFHGRGAKGAGDL